MSKLSDHAERALIFQYILAKHELPPFEAEDAKHQQMKVFGRLSGLTDQEVADAYCELEDAGMLEVGEGSD